MNLCEYGCDQEARHQFKNGRWCCSKSHKSCPGMKGKGIPDPKTNPANFKIVCEFCKRQVALSQIKKHKKTCYLNPDNLKLCPVCKIPIKNENKFCSKKCAGLSNSPGRNHTIETKRNISLSLGGKGLAKEDRICKKCGKIGIQGENFCDNCNTRVASKQFSEAGSLSWVHYEEELAGILGKRFGDLRKEKINGKYLDFCNDNIIIEFTFDHTKGTKELVERFQVISDDRKKIAFIPITKVGIKKKNVLRNIGVEIFDSSDYRYLLEKSGR